MRIRRRISRFCRDRARETGLSGLSMGMSGDYEAAIACGATHVRVGSAIFGSALKVDAQDGVGSTQGQ